MVAKKYEYFLQDKADDFIRTGVYDLVNEDRRKTSNAVLEKIDRFLVVI
jgi:hypothetical protein